MIDRDTYCKDCKRSIWGEYPDCDINIENDGKYCRSTECGCKIPMDNNKEGER